MKTLINLSSKIFERKELLFDKTKRGVVEANGCPYNFNRKTDALCFKTALSRFLRTGVKEDAFEVFFCYLEIFHTFGGYDKGINVLLNLLYDHESNVATLLMKHRDHYSHSAYVFALGLAVFMNNEPFRDAFAAKYGKRDLYKKFLRLWGIAGLFHDVGYPYEIAFSEVLDYGQKIDVQGKREELAADGDAKKKDVPCLHLAYRDLSVLIDLTQKEKERCGSFLRKGQKDINALFASVAARDFGAPGGAKKIRSLLNNSVTKADKYMDHAYFGAALLMRKLLQTEGFVLDKPTLDAIMAVLYHNSFYKFTYRKAFGKTEEQLSVKKAPLAYLLMLCDELQSWDRVPYGVNSKMQVHPWDIALDITDQAIRLTYYYETGMETAAQNAPMPFAAKNGVGAPINVAEIAPEFKVEFTTKKRDKKVYDHLSCNKFIDLRKVAESVHGSYCDLFNGPQYSAEEKIQHMTDDFGALQLEYKLSNIEQAKNYARQLDSIGCFYSDKILDYAVVTSFTEEEKRYLALREHIRWVRDKVEMGWRYGEGYLKYPDRKIRRERTRRHVDVAPALSLSEKEREKDYRPMDRMIEKLSAYGIRVYRLREHKPLLTIGCTGHRDLTRINGFDEERVRGEIRAYLRALQEDYTPKLYCEFADGADLLFAEEALKVGVEVVAVLPNLWKTYKKEHEEGDKYMQLLGQVGEIVTVKGYKQAALAMLDRTEVLFALWDGVELPLADQEGKPLHSGGTYDTIVEAKRLGKRVKLFN